MGNDLFYAATIAVGGLGGVAWTLWFIFWRPEE